MHLGDLRLARGGEMSERVVSLFRESHSMCFCEIDSQSTSLPL